MLLVGIIYLKSSMRYKLLILNTYLPDTLYLCEQGCEDPWLFFEAIKGFASKNFWETLIYRGSNITEHDFSAFFAVWVTSAKFCLHAANMKYCTQNERISICITVCMYICMYVCVYIYIYI
jgi:hypothetical protein